MKLQHTDGDVTVTLERKGRAYIVELSDLGHADVVKRHHLGNYVDGLRMYLHMIAVESCCYAASDAEQESILGIVS